MAFGITGKYFEADGKSIQFAVPYEQRVEKVASVPDHSIAIIVIYAHGAPGMIGDDDAESLAKLLQKKMRANGQIHLLGCSTAGIEARWWNPVGGLGLLSRLLLHYGMARVTGNEYAAEKWAENLAGDLSRRIPNVFVLGLAGISFPLSRIPALVGKDLEGYSPKALMADRFVYFNGKLSELP